MQHINILQKTQVWFGIPLCVPCNNYACVVHSPQFPYVEFPVQTVTVTCVEKEHMCHLPYQQWSWRCTLWPIEKIHKYTCGFPQQTRECPPRTISAQENGMSEGPSPHMPQLQSKFGAAQGGIEETLNIIALSFEAAELLMRH